PCPFIARHWLSESRKARNWTEALLAGRAAGSPNQLKELEANECTPVAGRSLRSALTEDCGPYTYITVVIHRGGCACDPGGEAILYLVHTTTHPGQLTCSLAP